MVSLTLPEDGKECFLMSQDMLIPIDRSQLVAGNEGLQAKFSKYPKMPASAPEIFLA